MYVTAHSLKKIYCEQSYQPPKKSHIVLLSISPKSVQYAHLENTKLKKKKTNKQQESFIFIRT